ncbi:MAG: hypothetical protein WC479_10630 [Candidatus Izemoplasmatales bacterium]
MRKKTEQIIQSEANKIQIDMLITLQKHSDAIEAICKACSVRREDCAEHFKKVDDQIDRAMNLISGENGLLVATASNTSNIKTLFWVVSVVFVIVATPDVVGILKSVSHGIKLWLFGA